MPQEWHRQAGVTGHFPRPWHEPGEGITARRDKQLQARLVDGLNGILESSALALQDCMPPKGRHHPHNTSMQPPSKGNTCSHGDVGIGLGVGIG